MNKSMIFVLLLGIFYSTHLCAMENNSLNVVCISLESRVIQDLRTSKHDIVQELNCAENSREKGIKNRQEKYTGHYYNYLDDLYRDKDIHEMYYINIILKPFLERMKFAPGLFLDYCYYLNCFKATRHINIEQLIACPDLLVACKKIRKGNGYSALGAVIIAPDVCIEDKRDFIRQLMMHGFELTQKDRELAALELYDKIPAEQKAVMMFFLCVYKKGDLSILPYDVIQYIIQYIISLYELW